MYNFIQCTLYALYINSFNDWIIVDWETEGRYRYSTMFHWELEGHRLCIAIAPFWLSIKHLWRLLMPFYNVALNWQFFKEFCFGIVNLTLWCIPEFDGAIGMSGSDWKEKEIQWRSYSYTVIEMLFKAFKGSMTHLQIILGVLKRNVVHVMWNDNLWWLTMKSVEFTAIMQHLTDRFILFFEKHLHRY